jgi:colanic acid/amylovoran biosynthesis glycosyltransferase
VHAHFATAAAVVARDAGALTAVPETVTAHAKDVFHRDNAPLLPDRLRGVAAVVTVTEHNAVHLRQVLPGMPVHVVRNGVHLSAARAATGSREGPLLCVSRMVPKKGIDCLLTAFAVLARQRPGLRLEIIGFGPLDAALRRQAEDLGIGGRVDFRGPLSSAEVQEALDRCSMVVLPCRIDESGDRDGLPTVLLEALACGTPVVTTDILGLPELVRHGETGLLVAPDDPVGLTGAIATLLDDPVHATALGAAGRRLVAQVHDCDGSAAQLQGIWAAAAR